MNAALALCTPAIRSAFNKEDFPTLGIPTTRMRDPRREARSELWAFRRERMVRMSRLDLWSEKRVVDGVCHCLIISSLCVETQVSLGSTLGSGKDELVCLLDCLYFPDLS